MKKLKLNSRELRAKNTKKNIYKISINLFNTYGFEKVTINDICNEANIGIGTFYHYFSSKNDIISESFKEETENLIKKYNTTYDSYLNQLIDIISIIGVYCENNKTVLNIILRNELNAKKRHNVNLFYNNFSSYIKEILEKASTSGEIRENLDKNYLFLSIENMIIGSIFLWSANNQEFNLVNRMDNFIKEFVKMIVT